MPQTADEIISLYNEIKLYVDAGRPIETKFLFSQVGLLVAEIERLRERCASDPWWWAYAEYPDEGWSGPYGSREEAEAAAASVVSDGEEPPEFSFRQHANPEGCAENERLSAEIEDLRSWVDDLQSGMYINCVYCGHQYGPKDAVPPTMQQVLYDHIATCQKHPLSKANAEIERLREDEKRLDWMDSEQPAVKYVTYFPFEQSRPSIVLEHRACTEETFREAIDAARAQEEAGE